MSSRKLQVHSPHAVESQLPTTRRARFLQLIMFPASQRRSHRNLEGFRAVLGRVVIEEARYAISYQSMRSPYMKRRNQSGSGRPRQVGAGSSRTVRSSYFWERSHRIRSIANVQGVFAYSKEHTANVSLVYDPAQASRNSLQK